MREYESKIENEIRINKTHKRENVLKPNLKSAKSGQNYSLAQFSAMKCYDMIKSSPLLIP